MPFSSSSQPSVVLYSGAPSDCSSRLRIALNLKGIPYDLKSLTGSFTSQTPSGLNPAQTVPTLIFEDPEDGQGALTLTQSIPALEYLEEVYPDSPLLPQDPRGRAQVRTLVNIISTDIHPLTTHRVGRAVAALSPGQKPQDIVSEWDHQWIERGIKIYEKMVEQVGGKYSFGDEVTLADVCVVPELWTGLMQGLEMNAYPKTAAIFERLMGIESFAKERTH